jgi:hypothetical protein
LVTSLREQSLAGWGAMECLSASNLLRLFYKKELFLKQCGMPIFILMETIGSL